MKKLIMGLLIFGMIVSITTQSHAAIKRIKGYYRSNGTYVKSHYRDTSNDGIKYNNANYLGLNSR